jgi:hypothetical protein
MSQRRPLAQLLQLTSLRYVYFNLVETAGRELKIAEDHASPVFSP